MSNKPISFNKVDISKIVFTKLEDNPRVQSQKIGYVRYKLNDNEVQFKIKTPKIISEVYGIPKEGPYYPDAKSRAHYKFGFCQERALHADKDINYQEIEDFMNLLISIDEMCDTDEFRKEQFGDKEYDKYAYQPLVRIPEEEKDEQGNVKYRPPYTKVKLDLEYCQDPDVQTTKPTFSIANLKDGKRTNVELNTFEDAVKMLKYLNKLRFIISFNKIYAQKKASGTGKNAKKNYGITLKATNIEVEQSTYGLSSSTNEDAFEDSDTDDVIASNVAKITRNSSKKTGNLDEDVLDDDGENGEEDKQVNEPVDDEDEDEEIVEEPPSKSVKKVATKSVAPKKTKVATK